MKSNADARFNELYRRVASTAQYHSYLVPQGAAAPSAPPRGVTYERHGLHSVINDLRPVFAECLAVVSDALAPERDALRTALRDARDELAKRGSDRSAVAPSMAALLDSIDRVLAEPPASFPDLRLGGAAQWRTSLLAEFKGAERLADEEVIDGFWRGLASGLFKALSAFESFATHGRSVCALSATRHAALWREWREYDVPIRSRWFDEDASADLDADDHWSKLFENAAACGVTLFYAEAEDAIEDALVVAGAALASGRTLIFVGHDAPPSLRRHPLVRKEASLADAFAEARRILGIVDPEPLPSFLFKKAEA